MKVFISLQSMRTGKRAISVLLSVSLVLLNCCLAMSQRPSGGSLRFDNTTWDFGVIKEADGVVSHDFNYFNLSSQEILLEYVTPGCSCTTVTYDHSPLLPGQSATLTVNYDPASQPGQFHQTVQVVLKSGRGRESYHLIVEGVVAEREKGVDEMYPFPLIPGLQVSSLTARFGFVQQGRTLVKTIGIVNTSNRDLTLDYAFVEPDPDIVVRLPMSLQSGKSGIVEIDFSPAPYRLGTLDNGLLIFPKGSSQGKAVALEGYAVQTLDRKPGAPSLRFQPTMLDFGKVRLNRKAKATVTLFNDGEEPLKIIKAEFPKEISINLAPGVEIPGGKSLRLEATVELEDEFFNQEELRVRLFTNDPQRPMRDIVSKLSVN